MYAIESKIRGEPAEVRLAVRQARTAPLLEDFGVWLKRQRSAVSPKSRLGEKLAYIGNHWKGLQVFLEDGAASVLETSLHPRLGRCPIRSIRVTFDARDVSSGRMDFRVCSRAVCLSSVFNRRTTIEPKALVKRVQQAHDD